MSAGQWNGFKNGVAWGLMAVTLLCNPIMGQGWFRGTMAQE